MPSVIRRGSAHLNLEKKSEVETPPEEPPQLKLISMQVYADKAFNHPIKIIKAFNSAELLSAIGEVETLSKTRYLLGYVRYEAKDVFPGKDIESEYPLLYFEVFEKFEKYLPKQAKPAFLNPTPALSFEQYQSAIGQIKNEISCGNTYELNYTFDFDIDYSGDCFDLYEYLLSIQRTPYNAFIKNERETLLSFSPELFFEIQDRHILTKPMKGTARRGKADDQQLIEMLRNDEKNRAENVMIVDLLRNDLGRISETGSVQVTRLFEVETHPTFHTMTSTVEARLSEGVSLLDVFKAVFPCGSVTGAPKIRTMQIIDEIERGSRGIYCGAIGFLSPEKITFSVPIRILQMRKVGSLQYRVGGAIVWDSSARGEWLEAHTKTKFLTENFKIIETLQSDSPDLDKHLARMEKAAQHYRFPFDPTKLSSPSGHGIFRILLDNSGHFETKLKELREATSDKVRISEIAVNSRDEFLQYKTTYRPYYQVDYELFYDELFFNEKGELTEGSRTNIVLELYGKLYTPPTTCGLLNGIYRQKLLDQGRCTEKVLYKEDVYAATAIYCVNSLRGMKKVQLI